MAAKKSKSTKPAKKPLNAKNFLSGIMRNSTLWVAIALVLIGILFIVSGAAGVMSTLKTIVLVIGILIAIVGVVNILGRFLMIGIFSTILGIAVAVLAMTLVQIAILVFGIVLVVYAIYDLIKRYPLLVWLPNLIVGGVLVLFYFGVGGAWEIMNILAYVVGALMIVDGAMTIISIFFKKKAK